MTTEMVPSRLGKIISDEMAVNFNGKKEIF